MENQSAWNKLGWRLLSAQKAVSGGGIAPTASVVIGSIGLVFLIATPIRRKYARSEWEKVMEENKVRV